MAASLLGGAAIGAVFGELLKAVLQMKDKAIMFKPTLAYLQTTLTAIDPVIKEIEQHNNDLGRPKEELELLIREMEEGTKLVLKCSKIHKLNFPARIRCQEQLVALVESLVRFFLIDMQAQSARDLKEMLLKVRRIHSAVNKMALVSTRDTTGSSSDSVSVPAELNQIEIHESTEMEPDGENAIETNSTEEAIDHIRSFPSDSDVVPVHVSESETLESKSTNSAEQVLEDITSLSHKISQEFSKRFGAVQNDKGKKKQLSPQEAASLIQISFRAYLIRRSKAPRALREVAAVKSKLNEIRAQFNDFSYRRHIARDAEERQRFSEKIIVLLLTVDAIEGVDLKLRSAKRSMVDELEAMLDVVDPQPA